MTRLLALAVVVALVPVAHARGKSKNPEREAEKAASKHDAEGDLVLNGVKTHVRWTDGDSFNIRDGEFKGHGTRLQGYNTLEAFGPVHRWGTWTPAELYELAKSASKVAAAKVWNCTASGEQDHYHRLLVTCPDLAVEMTGTGTAMAYAVDGAQVLPGTLEAQAAAMKAGKGMWAKGAVKGVVTSVHSADEDDAKDGKAYNRVVDTRTGAALGREHARKYATCEEVCETTDGDVACMVYVPFKLRYHHQPDCLRPGAPKAAAPASP